MMDTSTIQLRTTGDGSLTFFNAEVGEHYHSAHGAYQESKHVFVGAGLIHFQELHPKTPIRILEVGFGTGLNFLLSADYCFEHKLALHYIGIEAFPLQAEQLKSTCYNQYLNHSIVWEGLVQQYADALQQETSVPIAKDINLQIAVNPLMDFHTASEVDIIYFDAFAAIHQPEMWTAEVLAHTCQFLAPGGIFVTYSITGHLKRTLKALGFRIEKLKGAPGKREMLRAIKALQL